MLECWHSWRKRQYEDLTVFGCFNLKRMQRIRKELDKSNGDYEITAAWKPQSDHPDRKRTEFEIKAMIHNDPSKSITSIASDRKGTKTFGISHIRRERASFYHRLWRTRGKAVLQSFGTNSTNILWFFTDEICFYQDQILNSQNNCWLTSSTQDVPIMLKNKYPVYITGVWGGHRW